MKRKSFTQTKRLKNQTFLNTVEDYHCCRLHTTSLINRTRQILSNCVTKQSIYKGDEMNTEETKYQKAKERVEALRGFYIHLSVYVVVNLFLFLLNIITSPDVLWFYWPLLGWGIAIVVHALSVFWGIGRPFGADWEEKKVREIMEKEDQV